MGLLRSEEMRHGTLVLPSDRAREFILVVGRLSSVQILDMNDKTMHRQYKKYLQRIGELERILRYLYDEIGKLMHGGLALEAGNDDVGVTPGDADEFLDGNYEAYNLEKVEENLNKLYAQFVRFSDNNRDLYNQMNEAIEERNVAMAVSQTWRPAVLSGGNERDIASQSLLRDADPTDDGSSSRQNTQPDAQNMTISFSTVSGVIHQEDQEKFARILFRSTRGNTYTHFQPIEEELHDAKTGTKVKKSVFVVYYQGSSLSFMHEKIKNVCKTFHGHLYPMPDNLADSQRRINELAVVIRDKQKALEAFEQFFWNEVQSLIEPPRWGVSAVPGAELEGGIGGLSTVSSSFLGVVPTSDPVHGVGRLTAASLPKRNCLVEEWRLFTKQEKAIYATLNLFEGSDITLRADCWFPADQEDKIRSVLANASNSEQASAFLLTDREPPRSVPPTSSKTTEFSYPVQALIDTYGIPKYRELNPAPFALVLFPFLFGLMFGDIGHGGCFILFATYLIASAKKLERKKNGELVDMLLKARWLLLMMGMFATYAGFLYNDFFSMGVDIFGTRYMRSPIEDPMVSNFDSIPNTEKRFPYPFGFDPRWKGAANELIFTNSFKMKFAVIVAYLHMMLGIILKGFNAIYFNDIYEFVFEFIPQLIFLTSLVGYMDFLIVFKWLSTDPIRNQVGIIVTIIDMCMLTPPKPGKELFIGQGTVQKVLVYLMLVSVPLMLLPKPILLHFGRSRNSHGKKANAVQRQPQEGDRIALTHDLEESRFANQADLESDDGDEGDHNLGELMIHQGIETIEFVLGAISNTASYLRLWALSLAHQQLSSVFFNKTIVLVLEMEYNVVVTAIMLVFAFALFFVLTFGVMLVMDGLECFLHALRLQWVEFQNKFYKASGYAFQPFSFRTALTQ